MRPGFSRQTSKIPGWRFKSRGGQGFSLIELIVVMALLVMVGAIAAPQLKIVLLRTQLETQLQAFTQVLQIARSQAIRTNEPVVVAVNLAEFDAGAQQFATLEAHPLADLPGAFCSTDIRAPLAFARINIAQFPVVGAKDARAWDNMGSGVDGFNPTTDWDPGDIPCWPGLIDSFPVPDYNIAIYQPDGSLSNEGAFRFGDGLNFFEIRVAPAATAKIRLRKFLINGNAHSLPEGYYPSHVNDIAVWDWVWDAP